MLTAFLTPKRAFAAVAFFIGEMSEGMNYFQAIYLVGIGWNESAVGLCISIMGFTTLFMQGITGDFIDRTHHDRRLLLLIATFATAFSACAILLVREGNQDHGLMYSTKVIEGVAISFLTPCLASLILSNFGPEQFDSVVANNLIAGLSGYAVSAVSVGTAAYFLYPNIKYCFLLIGISALFAAFFIQFLPRGDHLMGRGFQQRVKYEEEITVTPNVKSQPPILINDENTHLFEKQLEPTASAYWTVLSERRTLVFCLTGFFFHFANANVLLVLGELFSQGNNGNDTEASKRAAIPFMAAATLISQAFMCLSVATGKNLTQRGVGRKVILLSAIATLPLRIALILIWRNAGTRILLLTQIFDGIEGGFFRVIHPYIVVDVTFGTGRFNLIMGLTNSFFWLGRTFSTLLGQFVVEKYGHVASLMCSMVISLMPVSLFGIFMEETMNTRLSKEESTDGQRDDVSLKKMRHVDSDDHYVKVC